MSEKFKCMKCGEESEITIDTLNFKYHLCIECQTEAEIILEDWLDKSSSESGTLKKKLIEEQIKKTKLSEACDKAIRGE